MNLDRVPTAAAAAQLFRQRKSLPRLLAAGALLLAMSGTLAGQSPMLSEEGKIAQELLQSLQEFRKLQSEVPDLKLPSANSNPGEDPYQQQLRSIQQRMELIRTLVQKKEEAETAKAKQRSSAAAALSAANAAAGAAAGSAPSAQPGLADSDAAEPAAGTDPAAGAGTQPAPPPDFPLPELEPAAAGSTPEQAVNNAPKYLGQTVVPSAVDPLELANSLFQTGNYELALKTYLAVGDKLDKPQDILWTEYFIASCRRILGDLPNAEKGYRALVESRRPTRPVEAARWWLDNVERRKNIKSTIDQIDSYVQGVSQELKPNGK